MTNEERSIFTTTLAEVCSQMWEGCKNCQVLPVRDDDPVTTSSQTMIATIGLAGHDYRGSLVVLARTEFFGQTYPPELGKKSLRDDEIVDWAGETSNQLLGRLKNRLGRVGLDFHISTPTVIRGDKLIFSKMKPTGVRHAMQVADERVDLFFEITQEQGKPLLPANGPVMVASLEGEGLLF